jgi:hypothetical protein
MEKHSLHIERIRGLSLAVVYYIYYGMSKVEDEMGDGLKKNFSFHSGRSIFHGRL